jgi:hypothetical protein
MHVVDKPVNGNVPGHQRMVADALDVVDHGLIPRR